MNARVLACLVAALGCHAMESTLAQDRPNIIIFFADDLGYGDLGCFGETRWQTPNIDSIASNGIRFTDFHVSQPVCSASRASLLTGCYANRIGIYNALSPHAPKGIAANELTIAEMLQSVGYATGMVGKWHLGDREPCLPLQHGFDSYLGLPYSNDMWDRGKVVKARTFPPLPLFDGNQVIDDDVDEQDQGQLTERYQQRALQFLRENTDKPFFLYFAHTFPHVPLFAGDKFRGRSDSGIYADVLEEFDEAVGAILREIRTLGLDSNTLVIFSSDNGPWLSYGDHAGTAGPLREGKGTVFEGGVRVPMLAQWPGHIPPGTTQDETAMTIDILPTIAKLVGAELPNHRIDGLDVSDLLMAIPRARCPHEYFYHYYRVNELQAIRSGPWKLILPHRAALIEGGTPGEGGQPGRYNSVEFDRPQLYNLNDDLGERVDLATKEPEVLARMLAIADQARVDLGDSLTKRIGLNVRPAADIDTGNR